MADYFKGKVKRQVAHQAGAYPGFHNMKSLGVFLLPLDGMLVHHRVPAALGLPVPIYTLWVERGTVRFKCVAQVHKTMSPASPDCSMSALTMRPLGLPQQTILG